MWAHSIPPFSEGTHPSPGKGISSHISKDQLSHRAVAISGAFTAAAQNHCILFMSQQLLEKMHLFLGVCRSGQFLPSPWPQDKDSVQFYLGEDHLHDPENVDAITHKKLQHHNMSHDRAESLDLQP